MFESLCVCVSVCPPTPDLMPARGPRASASLAKPQKPPPPSPFLLALREGGVAGVEGGLAPKWGGASPLRSAGGEGGGAWGRLGDAGEECADQSGNGSVTALSSVRGYPWVIAIASVCALVCVCGAGVSRVSRMCVCVCVRVCLCVSARVYVHVFARV